MLRKLAILTVALLLGVISEGQTTLPSPTEIYGKVIDAATKEPVPYVNIRLSGSLRTTMTDPKGEYRIKTIEKIDSVLFSYIGYKTRVIPVKHGKAQELNIELGSDALKLTEVTVKAGRKQKRVIDTTANYVYYQVLKHKAENRSENINTYKYESYEKTQLALLNPSEKFINFFLWKPFRFAFDNADTTDEGNKFVPGILRETICDVYYRRSPKSLKKYVKADKISGIDNPSVGKIANYQFAEVNIYDNLFVFAGQSFIAPFSPNGIRTYFYYLTDTAKQEGRTSYKLHFVGKVKEDMALKGYAWIDSATWAIRSIVFRPNEKANFNFVNDYTIKQTFTLVNNKHWLMSREELRTIGSLLKKKNALSLLITKTYNRRNFDTDIAIPDTIFKGPDEYITSDSAHNRSMEWWDTSRFESLTRQEKRVYVISDTIKTVRAWKVYEWFGRFFTAAYMDAGPISIGRVLNFASRNNVEGWRLRFGFETNPRFQHFGTPANKFLRRFYFTGYGAYGLKDKTWQYMAMSKIYLPQKNDKWQMLSMMYRYDMRVPGQDEDEILLTFDNIVTLISGRTLSKIMRVREAYVSLEREWFRGFSTIASINDKTFYDIPGVFNFSRNEGGSVRRVPSFNVTEFVVDTRYSYNDQYFINNFWRRFVNTKYPVFMLRYTAGLAEMKGDYFNYHNLHLTIRHRMSLPFGHTNYLFRAGQIFGKAPYTVCYLTQGNLGVLLDKFNYNLLREFEFVSDRYASLWIEHHFDGFFLNKIPGINKLRLREIIFVRSLVGSFSKKNADVLIVPTELHAPGPIPYVEAGFGIENILEMFRVDFMWRVTYRHEPGAPAWGVKFAFQPGF